MGRPNSSRAIVISGSMGAGKTTVMGEASDLLSARHVVHTAIDLDAIGIQLLPEPVATELHYRNLAAIVENCRAAGIHNFLIAAAIESQAVLADLKRALPDADVLVCRLTAPRQTMLDRLRTREPGMRQEEFLDRSRTLDAVLESAALEDFTIENDRRSVTAVAEDLLRRAEWITETPLT